MPELTFVFGPNKTFFFDSPKSWKFHNLPPTLRQLFNSSMQPAWRIAQPFCLALGPAVNSPEPIWYIGCKVLDEQEKLFYSQTYFERNYPDLSRWTKETPNGPRDCFVTFGTGLSYFACARGRGSLWAGVSSELTDKVQKALETPCCVALGIDQAWFVMWPNGSFAWKFYGKYGGLEGILRDAPPGSVSYLAISPYHKEQYFIAFVDRTVKYNFTGCPEWIPQIEEVFREWQAEILKNQRVSMALPPPSIAEMPAQWNQYLPNPGQPAYVAAHYAGSPPPSSLAFPPYSPDAATSPPQFAVELPAAVPNGLLAPASGTRPESIAPSTASSKKRHFFSRKKKSMDVGRFAGQGLVTKTAPTTATEGSQTCIVM